MNIFVCYAFLLFLLACAFIIKPFRPGLAKLQITFVLLFGIFSLGIYYYFGAAKDWQTFEFKEQSIQKMLVRLKTPQAVVIRLKEKLDQHPKSAEGWFLLGRLYRSMNEIDHATEAFEKAFFLDRSKAQFFNAYLEASFWQHHALFNAEDLALMHAYPSLKLDQENLNFLAGYYFQHQQYQKALETWRRLLGTSSTSPKLKQEITAVISKARHNLSLQKRGRLSITLRIDPKLKSRYSLNANVFIFAKASQSGPPIAAIRRILSELPSKVLLSDAESLLPNRMLSQNSQKKIYVGARLEPSGRLTKNPNLPSTRKIIQFSDGVYVTLYLKMAPLK